MRAALSNLVVEPAGKTPLSTFLLSSLVEPRLGTGSSTLCCKQVSALSNVLCTAASDEALSDRDHDIGGCDEALSDRHHEIGGCDEALSDRDHEIGGCEALSDGDHEIGGCDEPLNDRYHGIGGCDE